MNRTLRRAAVGAAATALVATPLFIATPAMGATTKQSSGTCTSGATWQATASKAGSTISWSFKVDSNRNGQTWTVRVTDNGVRVVSGTRVTRAPGGKFTVAGETRNRAGIDVIRFRATRAAGSIVCAARLSL